MYENQRLAAGPILRCAARLYSVAGRLLPRRPARFPLLRMILSRHVTDRRLLASAACGYRPSKGNLYLPSTGSVRAFRAQYIRGYAEGSQECAAHALPVCKARFICHPR